MLFLDYFVKDTQDLFHSIEDFPSVSKKMNNLHKGWVVFMQMSYKWRSINQMNIFYLKKSSSQHKSII